YFGLSSISFVRGGEALNVIYVPYLFKDAAWAERILTNDEFNAIYSKIASTAGVRLSEAWGPRSPPALQTTTGPIMKPEDVKGIFICQSQIIIFIPTMKLSDGSLARSI